ncbi:MAG: NAD(+) diphosphatase [Dehalococcoidia bacterium]|nr:NAD(+) diphosphatase [Dehalococcoidia bacterium]
MPHHVFQSLITAPEHASGQQGIWFCVGRNTVLVTPGDEGLEPLRAVHPSDLGLVVDHEHFLGLLDGTPVWAAGVDSPGDDPDGYRHENLFSLFPNTDEQTWALAGRAIQVAEWHRTNRFCGRCGTPTEDAPGERARKCPSCGMLAFPRLAPAVITLVEREDEVLLARGRTFGANPMYSTLAGFVEPGENLEECVAREIREEVGVQVGDIRYMGSQPWPFPHQLMIGFHATWASGEIEIDPNEIVDAKWFRADSLPNIPGRMSIARRLIDTWLERQR